MEVSVAADDAFEPGPAEVVATAIRIAPPPLRFDIRYRDLSPKVIETGLISPARITLMCRT